MPSEPRPQTLFHLVPANSVAYDALLHPKNQPFVSNSSRGPGLEVGYHVPSLPRGPVITRLGRNADLILSANTPKHPMSEVHVVFEITPATQLVRLCVRSKRLSSVSFTELPKNPQEPNNTAPGAATPAVALVSSPMVGDGVILYAQDYRVTVASYCFDLVWRTVSPDHNDKALKALAVQGHQDSLQRFQHLDPCDRPTEINDSEAQSWHFTRFNTAKNSLFEDLEKLRERVGKGAFGTVFSAVDKITGQPFAIKLVQLDGKTAADVDRSRALLHREIKVMERLKHVRPPLRLPLCRLHR